MTPIPTCNASTCRRAIRCLAALAMLWVLSARADEAVLDVIPLKHRTTAELLPVLQPFIAKDGVIKADHDRLIVRTGAANLAELRKLIAELDRPLRRLLIEVKQLSGDRARRGSAATDTTDVWRTEERGDADHLQQVEVTEGSEALIEVGRQIPLSDFMLEQGRAGTQIGLDTRYTRTTAGFYAQPRLNGDTVTIDISPNETTAAPGGGNPPALDLQSFHTTVTGRLGEWIGLAASSTDTAESDNNVITYATSPHGEQDRRILLRVTVVK